MPNRQNWLEGASADQPQAEGQGGAVVASAKTKAQLPANWRQLLGQGWELNQQGMPSRQAGRVVVVAQGQILLVAGHDFSDATHHWLFTPGGGIEAGESPAQAAARELAEETGIMVDPDRLSLLGYRQALFEFRALTCLANETFYYLHLDHKPQLNQERWTTNERSLLDGLNWYSPHNLRQLSQAGLAIYPPELVNHAAKLVTGWDDTLLKFT
jgi:mutT protein